MSQQDRYGYRNGYGDYGRSYYRGRRRPRSPFGDIKLASLGKLYADVPVDAVTKAMEGLNLQYKENRDAQDKYQAALANAQVMVGDDPEKQRMIKDIQSQVDQFVQNTGGAYEKGDDFVRGLAKDVVASPWLAQAIQNKNKFDEDQKALDQMRIKGLAPIYLSDNQFTTMGADGAPQQYQSYIGSEVNRRPVLENMFNNIKADRKDIIDDFYNITTVQSTEGRVNEVINEAFDILKGTKEYNQTLENEKARVKFQGGQWDETAQTAFDNRWKKDVAQVGAEFAYTQVSENPNRALFNAAFQGTDQTNNSIITPLQQTQPGTPGNYMSGTDFDPFYKLFAAGNDDYKFFYDVSAKNPTYEEVNNAGEQVITRGRTFTGPIIDLTNNAEEGVFKFQGSGLQYNTNQTGEVISVPLFVNKSNAYYKGLETEIQAALKKQDSTYNWSMASQDNESEMPYAGNIDAGGPRFGGIEGDMQPLPLSVNYEGSDGQTYTVPMQYIVIDGKPQIVESEPFMVHNVFEGDKDKETGAGRVLEHLSPTVAANYGVKTSYRTLYQDGDGSASSLGNIDYTINGLKSIVDGMQPTNPNYQIFVDAFNAASGVKNKFQTEGGRLDATDYIVLNEIDRNLMPVVLLTLNPDPVIERELSKTSTNARRQ